MLLDYSETFIIIQININMGRISAIEKDLMAATPSARDGTAIVANDEECVGTGWEKPWLVGLDDNAPSNEVASLASFRERLDVGNSTVIG